MYVLKGKSGTCYLKGVLAQPSSDQREGFVAGWKGGQNIFIDKGTVYSLFNIYIYMMHVLSIIIITGSICPGGYLNTHTYVTWEKESSLDSYASKFLVF